MAELWDQELYISYNLTFNKSRWSAPRDRRDGSEGLKLKMTLKVCLSSFFHSWVVASIGDLKLLALLGVLVLKSFCLPMNITLSLVKLGFINPSWPEPSLSDDLKKKSRSEKMTNHEKFLVKYKRKYVWKDVHLVNILPILHLTHHVIKDHTVSHTHTHCHTQPLSFHMSHSVRYNFLFALWDTLSNPSQYTSSYLS